MCSKILRSGNKNLSTIARASVCNAFLIAKIFYALEILHCARLSVQMLHRLFVFFIWLKESEPARRDNLFPGAKSGGLGVTYLFVSQLAWRFFLARTATPISSYPPPDCAVTLRTEFRCIFVWRWKCKTGMRFTRDGGEVSCFERTVLERIFQCCHAKEAGKRFETCCSPILRINCYFLMGSGTGISNA